MRRRSWVAGALYALGLFWALVLVWRIEGHLSARDRASFLAEGRRLAGNAAQGLGESWDQRDQPLRRLAGEPDTRFALLMDTDGEPIAVLGGPPALSDLGRPGPSAVLELTGEPPALAFVEPIWASGRRVGTLIWGRWTAKLIEARARERRALAGALAWWALAGALTVYFLAGRPFHWTRRRLRGK